MGTRLLRHDQSRHLHGCGLRSFAGLDAGHVVRQFAQVDVREARIRRAIRPNVPLIVQHVIRRPTSAPCAALFLSPVCWNQGKITIFRPSRKMAYQINPA